MKKNRARMCMAFLAVVCRPSMAMQDNIVVTMEESAVSFHTKETKQQCRQWLPKGQPGTVKAKIQVTSIKQMVWPSLTPRASSTPATCQGNQSEYEIHH
jgi:hypothetical protein